MQNLFFSKLFCLVCLTSSLSWANTSGVSKSDAVEFKIHLVSNSGDISFDKKKISVPFGKKIILTYFNDSETSSEILHNVAVIKMGMEKNVVESLVKNNYDLSKVDPSYFLARTKVLKPGEKDTISFQPSEPGEYTYICLMPGHLTMMGMKGTLTVEKKK